MRLLLATVALLLVAPLAHAQLGTGADPSAAEPTLWVHRNVEASTYWMGTVKDEPAHDDPDPGYNILGFALDAAGPGVVSWTIPLDPPLEKPLALDADGMVSFVVYFLAPASLPTLGTLGPGAATGEASVSLLADGSVVAEGEPQAVDIPPGEWVEVTWDVAPAMDVISGEIVLRIVFEGAGTGLLLGAADDFGWTHVTLPFPDVAPEGGGPGPSQEGEPGVVWENVTGDAFAREYALDGSTIEHVYNWTIPDAQQARVRITSGMDAGMGYVAIGDWESDEPLAEWFVETATEVDEVVDLVLPGDVLTIAVYFEDAVGAVELAVEPVRAETTASPDPIEEPGPVAVQQTGEEPITEEESKDTPALGILALAALAAAAVARRRS